MHECLDFSPEVRDQGCRVAIVVGPNGAQSVFVILLGPPFVTHLMGIVETHQPGTVGPVQSQRIVKPMRLLCRNRHLIDDEANPVARLVNHQNLPMEVEQRVKRRIAAGHGYHYLILIITDQQVPRRRLFTAAVDPALSLQRLGWQATVDVDGVVAEMCRVAAWVAATSACCRTIISS